MRGRTRTYIDIILEEKDLKKLNGHYTVAKMVDGQMYAIRRRRVDPLESKIQRLEEEIKALRDSRAPRTRKTSHLRTRWERMSLKERTEVIDRMNRARLGKDKA